MTSDAGFVKVYRSLLGHPAFRNDAEAMAFAWMVIRASWKPARVRYKDRAITLQRGQLAMSVRDMGAAMDRDKAWVERLWKRLKSETMIETVTDAGVSVVTICNYDNFQGERDTSETVGEAPSKTGARQAQDTEQRREEDKNTSGDKSPSVNPRSRKSETFVLPERIPAEPWAQFLAMRKRIGKPMTDHAKQLAVDKLDKLADDGWPPGDVLNNSTLNSYQGLFPPKDQNHGSGSRPVQQAPDGRSMGRTEAAARQALAQLTGGRNFGASGQARAAIDAGNYGRPVALPDPHRPFRHDAGR